MRGLIRRVAAVCLLRAGPQDLPYSLPLTRALVLTLAVVELGYASSLQIEAALPRVALSIAALLVAPWLLLGLRGRLPRYLQTLAALAATGVVFTLAFWPLAHVLQGMPPPAEGETPAAGAVLLGWLAVLLLGWKLMINAHIYSQALDWPRLPAMLIVIALFLLEFGLFHTLFGSEQ
jgi:hypothetical protein